MADTEELTEADKEKARQEALNYLRNENLWLHLEQEVQIATSSAARRFSNYIQPDDVTQHLWEWIMAAPIKIRRWHEDKDWEGFVRILGAVLYDEASFFGRHAKAEQLGYTLGSSFFYTRGMLMKLLPSVFNEDEWVNLPAWAQGETRNAGKALNEGFGWVATLADVSRAFSRLPREDRLMLEATYREGMTRRDYADGLGVPLSTAQGRHDAAVRRLWHELGGPQWMASREDREPDPGGWGAGRRAMSNAAARDLTDREADFRPRKNHEGSVWS